MEVNEGCMFDSNLWCKIKTIKRRRRKELKGGDQNNTLQLAITDILKEWRDHYEKKSDQKNNKNYRTGIIHRKH